MMEISEPRQHSSLIKWEKTSPVLKITFSAMFTIILLIGDWSISFIPFVQIVTFLIVLYFFVLGYRMTLFVLFLYVSIDCIVSGGLWPIFISIPLMYLAWLSLPSLLLLTRLRKVPLQDKLWDVAILTGLHGFIFGQTFAIGNTIVHFSNRPWPEILQGYKLGVLADIPWEIAQCVTGILSVTILLPPVYLALTKVLKRYS